MFISECKLNKNDCMSLRHIIDNFEAEIINMTSNIDDMTTGKTKEKFNILLEKDEQILKDANYIMKKCSCDVQLMKPKERKRHKKLTGLKALMQKKQEEWKEQY